MNETKHIEEYKVNRLSNSDQTTLMFSDNDKCHILRVKTKLDLMQISCHACHQTLKKDKYYCEEAKLFLCKECVLNEHRPLLTTRNPEHYDYKVLVEIQT